MIIPLSRLDNPIINKKKFLVIGKMLPKTWFCRNKSAFLFADCKQVLSKFAT